MLRKWLGIWYTGIFSAAYFPSRRALQTPWCRLWVMWRPGSLFPNQSLSVLMLCSLSFPCTGGPAGFSACSVLVSGGKATAMSSADFGGLPVISSCASKCTWSLLHSTSCRPTMYESVLFGSLWGSCSSSPAPLYLCEAILVFTAVSVIEKNNHAKLVK